MATRKSKNAESERLDEKHFELAINCLENKGTKKEACSILNISYNTTRLDKLIQKYKDDKANELRLREEKRGKPATEAEIKYCIQSYLEGGAIDTICNSIYRSSGFVNSILTKYSVPRRNIPHNYFNPDFVPEEAIKDSFKIGEIVYAMRYDSLAKIMSEWKPGIYSIFLLSDKWKEFAYQESCELASLDHLRKLGVNV